MKLVRQAQLNIKHSTKYMLMVYAEKVQVRERCAKDYRQVIKM